MLDEEDVRCSVDLQKRSYGLLKWVAAAVGKGQIIFDRAHQYTTVAESARDWLEHHASQVPAKYRPPPGDPGQLEKFSKLFSSFLLTSFDLLEKPGTRVVSECGCFCPVCTHLAAAPTLRAKKVTLTDKDRARLLKTAYLRGLAKDLGRDITDERAGELVDSAALFEAIALATYGRALIRRCLGDDEGTAILALWRQFAWNRQGSPKKDFELTAEGILSAEKRVAEAIAG